MSEFIIPNCTKKEINILIEKDYDWIPDSLDSNDVCVYATQKEFERILKEIGRTR